MSLWIVEPHDPLIARDGRPFNSEPGAFAHSLPIPFPGTMAGAWRTRAGQNPEGFFTDSAEKARQREVSGPLLAVLHDAPSVAPTLVAPAPADVVMFEGGGNSLPTRHRLVPRSPTGAVVPMPDGLLPLSFDGTAPKGKPWKAAPPFWTWAALTKWLTDPASSPWETANGVAAPIPETRTHVSIRPETGTADAGALFGTIGRRFIHQPDETKRFLRLGLALVVSDDSNVAEGVGPVAGERRLAVWQKQTGNWPDAPANLLETIAEQGACRLILLTPGIFDLGWQPGAALTAVGLTPRLAAAAVGRPVVVSGWDFEKKEPKPTRRCVPAGAVYFLKLPGSYDERLAWARACWMTCRSDHAQDRRDGYGLAALGIWNPKEG